MEKKQIRVGKRELMMLGYIPLSKDTPIPQTVEEIQLKHAEHGPINTKVEKPFRVWVSPIERSEEVDSSKWSLTAYQKLLTESVNTIAGAKGNFVLYVEYDKLDLNVQLIGMVYKVGK